jgi:protease I
MELNRRQICQMLAFGPPALNILADPLPFLPPAGGTGAQEKKTMPKVLMPIGDGSEVLDTLYAYYRIAEDDFEAVTAGPAARIYHLVMHEIPPNQDPPWDITRELPGYHLKADIAFGDVDPRQYVGLYVSGGRAPEYLRYDKDLMRITRHFFEANKPVGVICHGIEIVSAAGCIRGRTATTIPKCALDVEQGGATYVAKPCIVDGNLVTARGWQDLSPLLKNFMRMLKSARSK